MKSARLRRLLKDLRAAEKVTDSLVQEMCEALAEQRGRLVLGRRLDRIGRRLGPIAEQMKKEYELFAVLRTHSILRWLRNKIETEARKQCRSTK